VLEEVDDLAVLVGRQLELVLLEKLGALVLEDLGLESILRN
jgi:hypothetical protein